MKLTVTRNFWLFLFVAILLIDWLYILSFQQQATIISHFVIALPMLTLLAFAGTLLALIGVYYAYSWGLPLTYFIMLLTIGLECFAYYAVDMELPKSKIQFIAVMILNIIIFIYLIIYHRSLRLDTRK